jgi:hypothetical protein
METETENVPRTCGVDDCRSCPPVETPEGTATTNPGATAEVALRDEVMRLRSDLLTARNEARTAFVRGRDEAREEITSAAHALANDRMTEPTPESVWASLDLASLGLRSVEIRYHGEVPQVCQHCEVSITLASDGAWEDWKGACGCGDGEHEPGESSEDACDMWSVTFYADGTREEGPHCDDSAAEGPFIDQDGQPLVEGIGGEYADGGTFSYLSDDQDLQRRVLAATAT